MSQGHVPLDIFTGILPSPDGSVWCLEEEGVMSLGQGGGEGWRRPLKISLDAEHIPQRLYSKPQSQQRS